MNDSSMPTDPRRTSHVLGSSARNQWQVSKQTVDMVRASRVARPLAIDAQPQHVTFDLNRTALIVIDMQNDFCHEQGWLASIGVDIAPARTPIVPLKALLPPLRNTGVPVVWLNWGNRPDRLNLSPSLLHVYKPHGEGVGLGDRLSAETGNVLEASSWNAAVVDELETAPQDIMVDKFRMSGFWDTPLDSILRNLQVTTLLFAGVNVDQCVMCTLQDANFAGYDCILLEDCVATTSPSYCMEAALYNVKQCFGFVVHSEHLTTELEK